MTALAVLPLVFAAPSRGNAQNTATVDSVRAPVVVVLVDTLPYRMKQYDSVILRRRAVAPHDVILLTRTHATANALDSAVRTLLYERILNRWASVDNGDPNHTITIGVRTNTGPDEWKRRYSGGAQRMVTQLQKARDKVIPGVGTVPALEMRPPAPIRKRPAHAN